MFLPSLMFHQRWLFLSPAVCHELKGPTLLFLMETKKKKSYLERLQCHLGYDNLFIVPRRNLSRGLALLWMNDIDLHIRTFSPHHIDAMVNPRIDDA